MRYITVLGAGLLVGTALAVIIPEGVHALYLSEFETNQLEPEHGFHSNAKVAHRHLNELAEHDVKENLLPAHQHTVDLGHKQHSDTTHSAIGEPANE